jgi:ABC-type Na+ efflux pump permease subunit
MELFIPSLLVILISAFIAFLVVPRLGPMILGITSLIALIAAGIHHWSMFQTEYRLSTWQNAAAAYTPWVVLTLAVLAILGALLSFFTGASPAAILTTPIEKVQEAVSNSANIMPPANTATNPFTASLNRGITTFKNI